MRPDASENSQINSSSIVRAARAAGSQPYLPSGFQGRCKIATLHAGFGVIRGMSVDYGLVNFANGASYAPGIAGGNLGMTGTATDGSGPWVCAGVAVQKPGAFLP